MTREEAIEFGNMWLQINEDCKDSSTYEFFQMAIKAIEQEPDWTSVSEGLPKKNMGCLVSVGKFNFTEIARYSDLMGIVNHKVFYQGCVGHDSFKDITKYVKAWMPLPRDYMEDKNGTRKD